MTVRRFVYDRDLDCMVEIGNGSNREAPEILRPMDGVIRDIEPYRAMGSDVASDGKRPMIQSRSFHREYLRRNGYTEVGNSEPAVFRHDLNQSERISDLKRALGDH